MVLIKARGSDPPLSGLLLRVSQTSGGTLKFKRLQFCTIWESFCCTEQPESVLQLQAGSQATVLKKRKLIVNFWETCHGLMYFLWWRPGSITHFYNAANETGTSPWRKTQIKIFHYKLLCVYYVRKLHLLYKKKRRINVKARRMIEKDWAGTYTSGFKCHLKDFSTIKQFQLSCQHFTE